jgi:hypothetical protein
MNKFNNKLFNYTIIIIIIILNECNIVCTFLYVSRNSYVACGKLNINLHFDYNI